jgi:hypothetical protein
VRKSAIADLRCFETAASPPPQHEADRAHDELAQSVLRVPFLC